MQPNDHPLTQAEFESIYAKVPRLTVEVLVRNNAGAVFLTQRAVNRLRDQDLCQARWHLPGGTVRFAEPLVEAVKRIAKRELGIEVTVLEQIGYIEYPSHYTQGLDAPVGIVFLVDTYDGEIAPNEEATNSGWFTVLPENMHADQDEWLVRQGFLGA